MLVNIAKLNNFIETNFKNYSLRSFIPISVANSINLAPSNILFENIS